MMGGCVKLDRDGSWECQHARRSGEPAPARRLQIDGMPQPNPGRPTSARQRLTCPVCGTLWRVWTDLSVAKPAGLGLDEAAIAAVEKYQFEPATQNGSAVTVDLFLDVSFKTLQSTLW